MIDISVVNSRLMKNATKRDRDDRTANAQEHTPSISTRH